MKIPLWLKREFYIFSSMWLESLKFIVAVLLSFLIVWGAINFPAVYKNIKFWFFINYKGQDAASYWKLPDISKEQAAIPNNYLFIPKIGVQAPIIFLDTTDEKVILEKLKEGVVHYKGTALPGEIGNVFITGHSSYYWWAKGKYNHVFSLLDKLVIGDEIYINYNHIRYTYKVFEVKITHPKDLSIMEPTSEPILTLMTCTPLGTSFKRLVVRAKQIDPPPSLNVAPLKKTLPVQ